jgi:hypothetical protein
MAWLGMKSVVQASTFRLKQMDWHVSIAMTPAACMSLKIHELPSAAQP